MYRLVLYTLIGYLLWALVLATVGKLPFLALDFVFSTVFLLAVCYVANKVFAKILSIPVNIESDYITALILALIITPVAFSSASFFSGLSFLFWAGLFSQASKYILGWHGKHIFNPAAIAVVITAFTINQSASWWVGTLWMLPAVIIGGVLVLRKIQRFQMVLLFLAIGILTIMFFSSSRSEPILLLKKILIDSPILFFASIMFTEPLTAPSTEKMRFVYAGLAGFLFAPNVHLATIYSTPELALVVSNLFSYLVNPKSRLLLKFKSKKLISTDTYDFEFEPNYTPAFTPGQYMEWTLSHGHPDDRGNRRYFTIASAPEEKNIHLGIKFYPQSSSYKSALFRFRGGDKILAGSLSGDFVLPKDPQRKLAFIAGGIGITPFVSIAKHLLNKKEQRDIVLLYSCKNANDVSYKDIFDQALSVGLKTNYFLTEQDGMLNQDKITKAVPDYASRTFYLSGPHGMVKAFEKTLKKMGVPRRQIKIDFFPGYV